MNFLKRLILVSIVLAVCVGCDQTTKSVAKSVLLESETWSYFGDTVRLRLTYNDGAFLSLGNSLPPAWRMGLLTIGVGILLIGLLAYALFHRPGDFSRVLGVALVFSGGIGNLIDRILYRGSVVDFLNIGIDPVRSGIFNIADLAIMTGVFVLLSAAFYHRQKERRLAEFHNGPYDRY